MAIEELSHTGRRMNIVSLSFEPVEDDGLVHVHGHQVIGADTQGLHHDLGAQRLALLEPLVLPCIPEVRHNGDYFHGSQASSGVLQKQRLHQVVVGVGVLDDDDIVIELLLLDAYVTLSIGEADHVGLDELRVELLGQVLCETPGGGSTDNNHDGVIGGTFFKDIS